MSRAMVKAGSAGVVPTLKSGQDKKAAKTLRKLVKDANDGLRRILSCGIYIERLTAELPHGSLEKWLDAHCPELSLRTVYNWRFLARNTFEAIGVKSATIADLGIAPERLLTMPEAKLPAEAKPVRAAIDELIANKTAKQLFFEFKQAEEDEEGNLKPKVGRLKGCKGTSVEQRAAAAALSEQQELAELAEGALMLAKLVEEYCDDLHLGKLTPEDWARVEQSRLAWNDYAERVNALRASVKRHH